MQTDWQRFAQEAMRIHNRYLIEVVERFNLCPWAREARLKGRIRIHVSPASAPDAQALLDEVDVCMREESTEIGMLLCPLMPLQRREFAHLVAELRAADAQRVPRGQEQLAYADFHPIAGPDLTTPARLVPFLRRAPDPMIQIVRIEVLARARRTPDQGTSYVDPSQLSAFALGEIPAAEPNLSERVAIANHRTVERTGLDHITAIFEDIRADRDRTYTALSSNTPTNTHTGDR